MLLSKYGLDCQQYSNYHSGQTWESCSLRQWLNNDFLDEAFASEEQTMIISSTITEDGNPSNATSLGDDTTDDRIFILSASEANEYFNSDEERMASPTHYAKQRGAKTGDVTSLDGRSTCQWWLRTVGKDNSRVIYVHTTGHVISGGAAYQKTDKAVRPAMWIEI